MRPEEDQLPHLPTFCRAAERGSFTAAARDLGLTQAAVSQRVAALERVLGKGLFERRGGRVHLTEAGQRLHAYARQILDLHHEARRVITGQESPVAGELRIAASSIPGEHLLAALLAVFGRLYPLIRVRAAVRDSRAVLEQVEHGEVSVGLVGQRADRPHLEFRFLARDRMVLVAPPGHPLTRRPRLTADQLASHPLVLREAGSGMRHCFEKALEHAGRSLADFTVALELGSNEAIKEAVLRGVGVAVLSAHAVQKEVEAGRLCALEIHDLACDREMFVVRDRRRPLSPPARQFLAFLETHPLVDPAP